MAKKIITFYRPIFCLFTKYLGFEIVSCKKNKKVYKKFIISLQPNQNVFSSNHTGNKVKLLCSIALKTVQTTLTFCQTTLDTSNVVGYQKPSKIKASSTLYKSQTNLVCHAHTTCDWLTVYK